LLSIRAFDMQVDAGQADWNIIAAVKQ